MAALQQLHGGGAEPMQPQAPPPDSQQTEGREARALTQAIALLKIAMATEDSQQDKAVIATCVANLQKVLATEEKESHDALGGKLSPRAMAKAY